MQLNYKNIWNVCFGAWDESATTRKTEKSLCVSAGVKGSEYGTHHTYPLQQIQKGCTNQIHDNAMHDVKETNRVVAGWNARLTFHALT